MRMNKPVSPHPQRSNTPDMVNLHIITSDLINGMASPLIWAAVAVSPRALEAAYPEEDPVHFQQCCEQLLVDGQLLLAQLWDKTQCQPDTAPAPTEMPVDVMIGLSEFVIHATRQVFNGPDSNVTTTALTLMRRSVATGRVRMLMSRQPLSQDTAWHHLSINSGWYGEREIRNFGAEGVVQANSGKPLMIPTVTGPWNSFAQHEIQRDDIPETLQDTSDDLSWFAEKLQQVSDFGSLV